jgi:tRNA(Ile)-lysidine synthase
VFKLLTMLPHSFYVAVSGGPDSMAALDFLCRNRLRPGRGGNHRHVCALHFNHGTEHGKDAEAFVREALHTMCVPLIVGLNTEPIPPGRSKEEFWREVRYNFFAHHTARTDHPLIMAHTLDDAMETWVFTSLHGKPRLIPAQRDYVLRPFLLSRKEEMVAWCERNKVPFIIDPGNADTNFARVRIRRNILPEMLKINPGLPKVIRKMYEKERGKEG